MESDELETLRDNQTITEREYLDQMLVLYKKYYDKQVEYANQAKEAKIQLLKDEKSYLETVASAASSLLDDQIDALEDDKDKERKKYEDQIDDIDEIISEREKEKDAIQLQINALQDENDELDRQKNLQEALRKEQEALFNLKRAQSQRSKLLYQDGGFTWSIDDSAVKEANDNVADAQDAVEDARRDITIANLQIQIDAIQDGIDKLEDEKARLEELADESDVYFDNKINKLQDYQNEWKKALEIEERAIAITNLKSMFGEDAVSQVLNGNMELLSTWKQDYVDTMAAIDLANNNTIGSIATEWGRLADVSVNMKNAKALSELTIDELNAKAETLGISVEGVKTSSENVEASLNGIDTSRANEQFQNTGSVVQDAQEQIKGVVDKLNGLTSEVSSYQLPALNTEQFTTSLGTSDGTSGVLGQLNTFVQRFREICDSIPVIWQGVMSSISGQSGTDISGESVSYDYLFKPLLNAMSATKEQIDAKLQEYSDSWAQFNTDLGGIIGVNSSKEGLQGTSGNSLLNSGLNSDNSINKKSNSNNTDTIVGTITSGGEESVNALNEVWIPGFEGFASSIDSICGNVCSMIQDMSNDVIDMVNKALKALKELEAKNTGAYKIGKVSSGYVSHAVSSANAYGTLSLANGKGSITKDTEAVVNELDNEGLVRNGVLYEIEGGAQKIHLKTGDILFNHKQMEELKKNDRVTSNGGHGKLIGSFADGTIVTKDGIELRPLQPGDEMYNMIQKFNAYFKTIDNNVEKLVPNSFYEHSRQIQEVVNQINNSNIVNNRNQPTLTINGGINVTCPGVNSKEVMSQVSTALEKEFSGMALKAYQKANITR